MKRYTVAVPITGVIYVEVNAESEKEALTAALDSDGLTRDNIEEWEAHDYVTRGNVCSAVQNSIEVVSEEDIEDEEAA